MTTYIQYAKIKLYQSEGEFTLNGKFEKVDW